jgi:hypothetical protein
LIDGKHTDTALPASGTTDQPFSASTRYISQRGVHNLDQLLIAGK